MIIVIKCCVDKPAAADASVLYQPHQSGHIVVIADTVDTHTESSLSYGNNGTANDFLTNYLSNTATRMCNINGCSTIAERPRCMVRYSFGQKWKTGTGSGVCGETIFYDH